MTLRVDLNSDLGEGCAFDADIMPLITSANIACGFHAGSPAEARTAIRLAARHGVHAGAHPGFADRDHFGRRELERTEDQIFEETVYQIGALTGFASHCGMSLSHVKAHGALYNLAMRDDHYAEPLVAAAELFGLPIMALPGSRVEARSAGRVPVIVEGYADRRYRPDGSLVPRSEPNAFVESPQEAVVQALTLLKGGRVQSLCVHGDNPQALTFVRELRSAMEAQGIVIRAVG